LLRHPHPPPRLANIGSRAANSIRAARIDAAPPLEAVCDDMRAVSRIDALSEVVLGSRARGNERSPSDVAAEASDAAVQAARAAIVAADAAIAAANAAVRLIDEHDGKTIVLAPHASRALPGAGGSKVIHLPPATDVAVRPAPSGGSPKRSRPLRVLAVALILIGALLLADAVVTLVWQEPISALYTSLRQSSLSGALRREERERPTRAEQQALTQLQVQRARIAYLASALQQRAGQGSPVARIRIPRIGASFVVVNGTSESALRSGPGIYPSTAFPGGGATTAIAGHRTTYLAPFRHIDALRPGDEIKLEMPYADFTYSVTGSRVVAPTDFQAAVANVGYPRLVLSACTPLFSAAKRILVFARLTATVAKGPGLPPAVASRRA
jgi:sortase A